MNESCNTALPTDALVALIQSAQAATKAMTNAICEAGSSDLSDIADRDALAAASHTLSCSVRAAQDAMFRSLARPIAVFDTFVDAYGEINGG